MACPRYFGDGPPLRERDSCFSEDISQRMRVPDRLRVGPARHAHAPADQRSEELPAAYSMHIPDRLSLTDTPDLSPRPLFTKHTSSMWDLQHGSWDREAFMREPVQSPLRRSYSDQAIGRTPPGTPTHSRQTLRSQSPHSIGRPPVMLTDSSPPKSPGHPAIPPNLLSPQSMLQAAKELGQQASQKLLQTVTKKYSSRFGYPENHPSQAVEVQPDQSRTSASQEFWLSPEEDTGTAVEFMVLRRQVVKMSRRIAGVERQNAEHKQTELVLFSLLLSACLINGWLWMRR
ncbi:mitochondrial fission factor homolog B-like isoform X1 [Sinocyclocheilus anshuiensis]|uniref:mitochondrial fission factor homolog B-like isoform X1 n=1 Tax=Sinocyclocheilus anshuiensis TaxID=1608454 RepID=UPI0007B887EC|nr:PREDICTED: mitochondrial fission factor homolog B-like isoform X1 [Sinocyclocheilus anshuiensis]XP_016353591.1 PREDICTED: mitochondrial fission factor homolog B-like isoform X1 [Sinocyclocheilus anshuiensis]